jgi:hypothetical protein
MGEQASGSRLERRIRHDFPEPGSAAGVLALLEGRADRAGYDNHMFHSERAQAAIVLLANGDIGRLQKAINLAMTDWRDLLVSAGLADEDWRDQLDRVLDQPGR